MSAIDYRCVLTADGVRVDVSLFLGEAHQKKLPIANVTVTRRSACGDRRIARLRRRASYAFDAALDPTTLYRLSSKTRHAALQVTDVEVTSDGAPAYRITVRNVSSKPVMTFRLESYQDSSRIERSARSP